MGIKRRDFLIGASALGFGTPALVKAAVSPLQAQETAPAGASIVKAAVFPPIGFSRVGNGDEWLPAPEVPGLMTEPPGGFKQGPAQIKKQVQRFRVYGYDGQGRVVRELTASDGLRWTVHVANSKAAWYGFSNVLDLGDDAPGIPGALRNAFVASVQRERMLVINPGPIGIFGTSANQDGRNAVYRMAGRFWDKLPVTLGHLRTDADGRLLVFPGDGVSSSALPQNPVRDFTNNDGWHDDWCDGWVKATVRVGDADIDCEPAWVVCCGPKFAPQIEPIVSLYDVIREVMISIGHMAAFRGPASFRRDVLPILKRAGMMQWLAQSAYLRKTWIGIGDLSDPALVNALANSDSSVRSAREAVLAAFRKPGDENPRRRALPLMLGDGVNYPDSKNAWLTVTVVQYEALSAWARGDFVNDLNDPAADAVAELDDLPLAQRPEALTRAALDACSGGAFHPGVEITWPVRHGALYRQPEETPFPFRIAIGNRKELVQNLGLQLNPTNVFAGEPAHRDSGAPIGPQMPGDLTRWMGVPWQGDAFSCQSVLTADGFPTPVWWPALLPVDILPEMFYRELMRMDLPAEERLRFYHSRVAWSRGVAGIGLHVEAGYTDGLRRMLELWTHMGVVVSRPGPVDIPGVAADIYVEVQRGSMDLGALNDPN